VLQEVFLFILVFGCFERIHLTYSLRKSDCMMLAIL